MRELSCCVVRLAPPGRTPYSTVGGGRGTRDGGRCGGATRSGTRCRRDGGRGPSAGDGSDLCLQSRTQATPTARRGRGARARRPHPQRPAAPRGNSSLARINARSVLLLASRLTQITNTMAIHNGRQRSEPQSPPAAAGGAAHASQSTSVRLDSTQPAPPCLHVRTRTRMPGGQLLSSATLTTRHPCCPNLFAPVEQHWRAPRTLSSDPRPDDHTLRILPASQSSQAIYCQARVSVRRTSLQIDPHAGTCSPALRH